MEQGRVRSIHVAVAPEAPMEARESIVARAGAGLEGDRYCRDGNRPKAQVTLVAAEALAAAEREHRVVLPAGGTRRNIMTEGIDLNRLVGGRVRVGEAVLHVHELCEPCGHLEKLSGQPVKEALRGRGGLRAEIVEGGTIRVGDAVVPVTPVREA